LRLNAADQRSDWTKSELETAVCPQKYLAEYESDFRYESQDDTSTKQAKEITMKRTVIRDMFTVTLATALAMCVAPMAQAADKGCSNATLTGTFAYTNTGFFTAAAAPPLQPGPFAGVGLQTFDGKGGTTAITWVSVNGNILQGTIKGTYSVNPDCTGTLTIVPSIVSPPVTLGPGQVFFVIDDNGNEFRAINLISGHVITTVARRQFSNDKERE
jgi:hypothetical protein